MTGLRLDLANPGAYRDYVAEHLAPVATELHRVVNELLAPGATSAEEWSVDMVPEISDSVFRQLDQPLHPSGKSTVFDGAEYFTLPKELLRAKQLKVQLVAVVYGKAMDGWDSTVDFRLVRDDGMVITNSTFFCNEGEPTPFYRTLPFGDTPGSISPDKRTYYIEGRSEYGHSLPVCRRFSLSFVYI